MDLDSTSFDAKNYLSLSLCHPIVPYDCQGDRLLRLTCRKKPPPENARKFEVLGVVVGGTALGDVGENVVDAGAGIGVDEGLRDAQLVWITKTKYRSRGG